MNILVLTSAYPKFDGDSTAPFMASITEHVAGKGHTMHVVLPEHAELDRRPIEGGIHFYPFRYSPRRSWTPWGYAQSLEAGVTLKRRLYALAPAVFVSARRMCASVVRRQPIDVVHAHWVIPNGAIAAGVCARSKIPLVVTLHGSDVAISEKSKWLGAVARRTFGRADAVTGPNETLLERARRLGASGHVEMIPWGADPGVFRPDAEAARALRRRHGIGENEVIVLGVGRFVHWKGFDDLLEAVALARTKHPTVRLVLAGDGDLRGDLEAHAARIGLADHVTFTGMLPREEVVAQFAAADIVAVPSIHFEQFVDTGPTVALEAMAAGKPLVATPVGALPQLLGDGRAGRLVPERDPGALADAIGDLAADSTLRGKMGDRGRELVLQERNWDTVANELVALFERVRRS
jgi:glycosyltransferase involved in cell wall biosynthesis